MLLTAARRPENWEGLVIAKGVGRRVYRSGAWPLPALGSSTDRIDPTSQKGTSMLLSNKGKSKTTWDAWRFYRDVRTKFGDWKHVELTFASDPPARPESTVSGRSKLLRFVDESGNTLELHGVNFGYRGGTPGEVVETLVQEGFNEPKVIAAVFNSSQRELYPQTLVR